VTKIANTHNQTKFFKNWRTLLGTTNHAEIGILYIVFAIANLVIAGCLALLIRTELAFFNDFNPEINLENIPQILWPLIEILVTIVKNLVTIVDAETYSVLFTAHGTTMIFMVIFPIGAGFANYLIPKLIGAPEMDTIYTTKFTILGNWC